MASFQKDSNGNRIKTDILTLGYFRQDIENQLEISIPSEIKGLCFDYWFIKVCDEWDKLYLTRNEDRIVVKDQIAKKMTLRSYDDNGSTIYGCHIIHSGEWEWLMKINCSNRNICIGIIEDNDQYLKDHTSNFDYDINGYGCWWFPDGSVSAKGIGRPHFTKKFQRFAMKNIIVGMKVNMTTKKLGYSIDGDDYVEVPRLTLDKGKYRLAVTLFDLDDTIELL